MRVGHCSRPLGIVSLIVLTAMLAVALPVDASYRGTWSVETSFSKNPARQEETITVTVTFTNEDDNQMKLHTLGIHFDWMATDYYYFFVYCDSILLASGQSITESVWVELDKDLVTVGIHSYYYYYAYFLQDDFSDGESLTYSDLRVLERDKDGDGVADSDDAFPDDPTETKDTDKDGVGDNKDAFPNDPKRWEAGDILRTGGAAGSYAMIGGIIIVIVIVFVIAIFFIKRRKKSMAQPTFPQPPYQPSPQQYIPPPVPPLAPLPQQPMAQPYQPMAYQPSPQQYPPQPIRPQYPPQLPPQYPPQTR